MTLELKDGLTIASIFASFAIGAMGLAIGLRNSKKTIFINSVTASRVKWIETVRNSIAEFCGLTLHLALTEMDPKEKRQIIEKIDRLRFVIKLQLNRSDKFDKRIIDKVNLIPNLTDPRKINELEKELNELVEQTQDLLKLEWEGVKEETMKGNLSKKEKKTLYDKYLQD
jgi:hypothetical protein